MNILECTIKMKREAQSHYECLAGAVENGELKRLFSLLASAEGEYVDKLGVLEGNMRGVDGDTYQELDGSVCVYSPHIDPKHVTEILRDDPDAYRHVVQEEEDTIEFFVQLSDQAESEQLKRICQLLASKEREHLKMLEEIYSFVEDPRTYLEWGEFSNLKSL